jgi:mRNA-degrading endonuclease YafQ of YafQ-DinJ toxin-antitoxin module
MLEIIYVPSFIRAVHKLPKDLQDEAIEKINLFKSIQNHKLLKVHKLHGQFKGNFAFSVNYKFRIAFEYISKTEVLFLDIGDHDIYK